MGMAGRAEILRPKDWQLEYLFSLGPYGWLVHGSVVILTYATLEWAAPYPQIWCGVMLALSSLMIGICISGRRGFALRAHGLAHTVTTGLVALTWTAGAFVATDYSYDSLLFYTLALGGTALGAVAAQHSVLRSCYTSLWLSVPGLAYAHMLASEGLRSDANGVMITLYALVLTFLARRMNVFLSKNRALSESLLSQLHQADDLRRIAEDAAQAKTRFLAYVSHDLRQPVHSIGLQVEAMKDFRLSAEPRRIVNQIDVTLRALSSLFQSLLDLSAIELNQLKVHSSRFDLCKLVVEIVEQNRLAMELNGCSLVARLSGPVYVETDRALLGNVVQNLVGNAIKHAAGCRLTIGVRTNGRKTASILILDRGPGMDTPTLERLFGDFETETTANPIQSGVAASLRSYGLGLSLVQQLTALLGLSLTCLAKPGRGTLFVVSDIACVAMPAPAEHQRAPTVHPLNGLRVAVYDDDEPTLIGTVRLLSGWHCEATPFDRVDELPPRDAAVVVTDYQFADGKTARPLFAAVRAMPTEIRPGLILVTGSDPENYADLVVDGDCVVLRKPAQPAQLRASLTALSLMRDQ